MLFGVDRDIDECPACGDAYELSYQVVRGTHHVGDRLQSVAKVCHAEHHGKYYAYVHVPDDDGGER